MLPQAAPSTRQMLGTARVIFALACDRTQPLSTMSLAARSGLTEEAVEEILRSPVWFEAMEQEFRQKLGLMLSRGMSVMDEILASAKARDADKVSAYRALLTTYEIIDDRTDANNEFEKIKNFQSKLEALRKLKSSQKVTVVSASSGGTSRGPDPDSQGEEQGRNRTA